MSEAEFEALVARLEAGARQRPGAYRRKVLGLAVLGYGYVLAILGLLLAATVVLAVLIVRGTGRVALVKLAGFLLVLVWIVNDHSEVKFRRVQIASIGQEEVVVSHGVDAGEKIVALGAHLLHEGQAVDLAKEEVTSYAKF